MPDKFKCFVFQSLLVGLSLAFLAGCQQSQKKNGAIGLYVDAIALSDGNDPNQAIDKLQQAVEKKPDFALAWSLMGNLYLRQEKYPQCVNAFQKAT